MKFAPEDIDIKDFLPHRAPMLMVKDLLAITETEVKTNFTIYKDCVFVTTKGNLSETGLIENAAQTSSAIVGQSYFDDDDKKGEGNKLVGYISAIKKASIYKLPNINDTLITKAKLVSRMDTGAITICTITAQTFNKEELIVNCTMNFLIHEVPS